ncbi:MAG: MoxR family ATPase [Betaproteobacteria bacterium]|jgi:MoxR-like ATPase|nr:MAG: MoxR family ATPase [Betaproteobacteria bacterium]
MDISQQQFEQATTTAQQVRSQIGNAVVGQINAIDQILAALIAGGHVLIEGVPGLGKTLLVRALAQIFGGQFARIQFTPDLMPADVTGHTLYDQNTGQFTTRRGPVFTNLLLADEINRAPAKTQAALLEVMQEGQVTIEGASHQLEPPFMVLATQNPIEQEGTYALPEAQLDRFLMKVRIDYPDPDDEVRMVAKITNNQIGEKLNVSQVNRIVHPDNVLALQSVAAAIRVDDAVFDYAVRIVRATRSRNGVSTGAGPRGGIALVRSARSLALMQGRSFVTPDDIKCMALPSLRHRIALAPEFEIEGQSTDQVLTRLLEEVEAPRV